VALLVRSGADLNARDHAGRSIAALAAAAGNTLMLPVLATLGATDAQEQMRKASLHVAAALIQGARDNQVGAIRLLLAGAPTPTSRTLRVRRR
jgi:hypothetical protein